MTENELVVIGETFAAYEFRNWRECCNFLMEKVYNLEGATTLLERKKDTMKIKCPLSGNVLTIMGTDDGIEAVYKFFVLMKLFRR